MVLFLAPYLLWGMRNGTCQVSVYQFLLIIPLEYSAVGIVSNEFVVAEKLWMQVDAYSMGCFGWDGAGYA